jgi:membrane protein insertase Oxa1/YidC/SpoIIIJ
MSNNNSSSSSSSGLGFLGALTLLFVGLKLTHFIDWSWWWITVPIWGPVLAVIAFLVITFVCAILKSMYDDHRHEKRMKILKEQMEKLKEKTR